MNVLFISALFPYPLYSGGQVRIYNLIRELSRRHSITLAAYIRHDSEKKFYSNLDFCDEIIPIYRGSVWNLHYLSRSLFSKYPLLYASYDNAHMRKALADTIAKRKIDLIHVEPSYVWPGLPEHSIPVVVSEHNIEYSVYQDYVNMFPVPFLRPLLALDVRKHERCEKSVWKQADYITAVSDTDAKVIQSESIKPVSVVPNGINPDQFSFKEKIVNKKDPLMLFVGNFKWIENRDAAYYLLDKIWPAVKKQLPKATLRIVGRYIPDKIKNIERGGNVEFRENTEDIASEYGNADFLIAPIRVGGGTKFKILEAMASGLPVITTPKGMEGLPIKHLLHVYVANSPDEFALAVKLMSEKDEMRTQIIRNAEDLVNRHYTWDKIAGMLENVWKKCI